MTLPRRCTRRGLLKGATAAVLGTPTVVSASVLAAGNAAPSERVNLGHVGVGIMGSRHVERMARRRDVQILAVCDVRQPMRQYCKEIVQKEYSNRDEYKNTYKGLALYNDFRELLARDDINAVFIASPEHWHAIQAIEAAKAGKDIYCQKPMAHSIREARAMVSAVRRFGRVFQTGSQQRSSREFRFACEMVHSGRIGELKTVEVYVGGPSVDCYLPEDPIDPTIDWNMWLGPAPWRPYNADLCQLRRWYRYRDYSGGSTCDWGSHHFDIAQWGIGTSLTGPTEILLPDEKDRKWLTFKYANGVTLTHGGPGSYSVVEGKRGGNDGIVFNGTQGKIEVTRGYLRTWPETMMQTPTAANEVHLYKSPGHEEDWLRAIRTRQKPICDVEIGCRSVSIGHLANIAYWLKRSLKWNPEKEEFIGDPGANRWLDCPRREPWTL